MLISRATEIVELICSFCDRQEQEEVDAVVLAWQTVLTNT
jgi:hypothetical protein